MSSAMMQQEQEQPEDSSATATETAAATATATATATVKKPPVPGIDIHKALDILADRSASHHAHDHDHGEGDSAAVEGCHVHQTEELKSMGQTIDLLSSNNNNNDKTTAEEDPDQQKQLQEQEEARRKERAMQLQTELKSMTVKELLKTVLETQQQRVATYQGYNESLTQVLQSANMTAYISSCAHTTAAFAVLSETIRAVRTVLVEQHGRQDLEKLLTTLQQHEKLKLNLTAALHLERIRERNENMNLLADNTTTAIHKDQRISQLLRQGVESLQEKLQGCVEDINEAVEEIRYAWIEEEGANEEE